MGSQRHVFYGVFEARVGTRDGSPKSYFLRGKYGLCGSMKIGFRSFKPPLLANVSLIFALFSASRHLKPFEASNGFMWNHLKPKSTSLFIVSCRENDVFLCGFDACGPPTGGFWCPKAMYFTSFLSFCISPATMSENQRDLRCFFER